MPTRTDAHAHFFHPGYVANLPQDCRRTQPDEVTLYRALARQYDVEQVLAVGFEGEPWAAGNNRYLAEQAATHPWIRPLAYVHELSSLDVPTLEALQGDGFVGLSLYLFADEALPALQHVPSKVWEWLVQHGWLLSVNSHGPLWSAWEHVLNHFPDLCILVSHLGLPATVAEAPTLTSARDALQSVCALARYPGVYVKFSGFYALTEPAYAYPHQAAWPYAEILLETFSPSRLVWGSDFSPSLEWVSCPQTFALLAMLPGLDAVDRARIEDKNLAALLANVSSSRHHGSHCASCPPASALTL